MSQPGVSLPVYPLATQENCYLQSIPSFKPQIRKGFVTIVKALLFQSYPNNVGKTIINHLGMVHTRLYHLVNMIWGMVCSCISHVQTLSQTYLNRRPVRGGKCVENRDCKFAHGEEELRVSPNVYKTQHLGSCKSHLQ